MVLVGPLWWDLETPPEGVGRWAGAESGAPWWAAGESCPAARVLAHSLSTLSPLAQPWTAALPGNLGQRCSGCPLPVSQLLQSAAVQLASQEQRL